MKPLLRNILISAWVVLTAGASSAATAADAEPLSPPQKVRTGILSSLSEAPIFVAMERGYFAEEGLEVELVNFVNTANMVAPLSTGDLDIGAGAPTVGFINAINRGIDMRLVADKGRNAPGRGFNAVIVRKDLVESGQVKGLGDFKGLKVGSPSRLSPVEFELEWGLRKHGLDIGDVEVVQMRFPDMVPAFANKAIDAAVLIEPLATITELKGHGVRLMGVDEIYPDYQIAGVLYGPKFAAERAEAAKRWLVAYVRGIRDFNDALKAGGKDRQAVVDILIKHTSTDDPKLYERMAMPGFDSDGYMHLQSFEDTMQWFKAQGGVQETLPLPKLVDYSFLEYVHERIGRRGEPQTVK